MTATPPTTQDALVDYVLCLADDALFSAQLLGQWISRAPELEEDVALANIALDQLGQARLLLAHAGELEGEGRDEDALAYRRDDRDFRNVWLVERPQTDFAVTMARLLIFSTYQCGLYSALAHSGDDQLAGVGAKAIKEVTYHVDHAANWVIRLGDGTVESHRRMQAALDAEWPFLEELFEVLPSWHHPLVEDGVAIDPVGLREVAMSRLVRVIDEATLKVPEVVSSVGGGRRGLHTEHLGMVLAPMQHLARSHPGASW